MDPTDAEIEAALQAAPHGRWRALAEAVEEVAAQPAAERVRWAGGERVGDAVQAPYPVYSEAVERLLAALGGVGAIVVFRWMDWDGGAGPAPASAADAARVVTSVVRGERFGDGTIATALDDGRLVAAARRLLAWYEA